MSVYSQSRLVYYISWINIVCQDPFRAILVISKKINYPSPLISGIVSLLKTKVLTCHTKTSLGKIVLHPC